MPGWLPIVNSEKKYRLMRLYAGNDRLLVVVENFESSVARRTIARRRSVLNH